MEALESPSPDLASGPPPTSGAAPPALQVAGLVQRLTDRGSGDTFVLTVDCELTIARGVFATILGPSGCGKTTLLSVLGLLRRPTDPASLGRFVLGSVDAAGAPLVHDVRELWRRGRESRIEALRRRHVGFALQSGELLASLTVRENIAAPLCLNGVAGKARRERVEELLAAFELLPRGDRDVSRARINRLSGGEYQRVVLARAIAHRPAVVFVDEPTSSLNREMARQALRRLKERELGSGDCGAVVMITHDQSLSDEFADLVVRLEPERRRAGGRVVEVAPRRAEFAPRDIPT